LGGGEEGGGGACGGLVDALGWRGWGGEGGSVRARGGGARARGRVLRSAAQMRERWCECSGQRRVLHRRRYGRSCQRRSCTGGGARAPVGGRVARAMVPALPSAAGVAQALVPPLPSAACVAQATVPALPSALELHERSYRRSRQRWSCTSVGTGAPVSGRCCTSVCTGAPVSGRCCTSVCSGAPVSGRCCAGVGTGASVGGGVARAFVPALPSAAELHGRSYQRSRQQQVLHGRLYLRFRQRRVLLGRRIALSAVGWSWEAEVPAPQSLSRRRERWLAAPSHRPLLLKGPRDSPESRDFWRRDRLLAAGAAALS